MNGMSCSVLISMRRSKTLFSFTTDGLNGIGWEFQDVIGKRHGLAKNSTGNAIKKELQETGRFEDY